MTAWINVHSYFTLISTVSTDKRYCFSLLKPTTACVRHQTSVGQVSRVDASSKVEVVWADNSTTVVLPQVSPSVPPDPCLTHKVSAVRARWAADLCVRSEGRRLIIDWTAGHQVLKVSPYYVHFSWGFQVKSARHWHFTVKFSSTCKN